MGISNLKGIQIAGALIGQSSRPRRSRFRRGGENDGELETFPEEAKRQSHKGNFPWRACGC